MTTFRTVLKATGGNNVGIVVPEEIVQSFDRGKRVPVVVTINGDYTYKTTIGVMGDGFWCPSTLRRGSAPAGAAETKSKSTSFRTQTADRRQHPGTGPAHRQPHVRLATASKRTS